MAPNFVPGKITLALAEADANQAVTVQLLDQYVINFARSATSENTDLDSWMAQFAFPRLPAETAFGTVTFSTPVANAQAASVPVGTVIQIPGGAMQYVVIANPSMPAFNSATQAYVLPAGQLSINATAQSLDTGSNGNVQANQLTQIVNTLYGVPSVTNATAITNGKAAETDAAYRARFIDYINNLSRATRGAIEAAELGIAPGLKVALFENVQFIGNPPTDIIEPDYGWVWVILDDGSGDPPQALLDEALVTLSETVAFGIRYGVLPPEIVAPDIELTIRMLPGADFDTVVPIIQAAVVDYVNALPIGTSGINDGLIFLSQIECLALMTPGVQSVQPQSVTIDDQEEDYQLEPWQEALITTANVSVTQVS